MIVFTLQNYDLRSFSGRIELDRGTYRDRPEIVESQSRLYKLIEYEQVIWCSQMEPSFEGEEGKFIHTIAVDSRDIVAVIDTIVWSHILGYKLDDCIPPEEYAELRRRTASSGEDRGVKLQEFVQAYVSAHLTNDPWSAEKKEQTDNRSDQLV